MTPDQFESLSRDQKIHILHLLEEFDKRCKYKKMDYLFTDSGYNSRDQYPKHLKFFKAGADYSERLLSGGNRVGKTLAGGYEMCIHLTGRYPTWWEGKRFYEPIEAWACGTTSQKVKETIQQVILGMPSDFGTGLLPKDSIIGKPRMKHGGIADAVEDIYIKHVSGGTSKLSFKSYDQKRTSFEGTSRHVIWLDEEAPIDIYTECLTRTATVDGIIYMTATPLEGLTPTILQFLPGGKFPDNGIVVPTEENNLAVWEKYAEGLEDNG